jgi:hypothetical protein
MSKPAIQSISITPRAAGNNAGSPLTAIHAPRGLSPMAMPSIKCDMQENRFQSEYESKNKNKGRLQQKANVFKSQAKKTNAAPFAIIKTITFLFESLPAGMCRAAVRGLSASNFASASLLKAIAPFLAVNMQHKISSKIFAEGNPFAAISIEASANGKAKSMWLRRTSFPYSVIFERSIGYGKLEILYISQGETKSPRNIFFVFFWNSLFARFLFC